MVRYIHTNIIAKDVQKVMAFYQEVLGCYSIGQKRSLQGAWLDQLTGIKDVQITGEHLALPGYSESDVVPTLEIFSYNQMAGTHNHQINEFGFMHIAFEVEDVEKTLAKLLAAGGSQVGELVHTQYEDGRQATFVYAKDVEGNIVELQSWQ